MKEKNKPNLYILIGIPASGKSSLAKAMIQKNNEIVWVSTDNIRSELCNGDVSDQTRNQEVFELFHARIRDALVSGHDVIADATNITMKSRKNVLKAVTGVHCKKIAIVVEKSYKQCLIDNQCREWPVPEYVLERQLQYFRYPVKDEGFDEIYINDTSKYTY